MKERETDGYLERLGKMQEKSIVKHRWEEPEKGGSKKADQPEMGIIRMG